MEHARLISIAQKLYINLVKIVNYVVLRGLFEGAQYNSEDGLGKVRGLFEGAN